MVYAFRKRGNHIDKQCQRLSGVRRRAIRGGSGSGGGDGGRWLVRHLDDGRGGGDRDGSRERSRDVLARLPGEAGEAHRSVVTGLATVVADVIGVDLAVVVLLRAAALATSLQKPVPDGLRRLEVRDSDEVLVHVGSVDLHCVGVDEA